MNEKLDLRFGQKVYVSEPRMPQYGRLLTIYGSHHSPSLGIFLVCKDDQGNRLLLQPQELSASKPQRLKT
ncbi:hypothetical protein I8752_05175 [Nostocaceae cyanobacterium CENA369]|uniref:Uncharacterized protein n=1 Tax=Dendronalium phyllosphericum CENA369 TaxID=1725256 RepID=A0A8J7I2X2_9NOST|nr:hypothetical protein [Dendronalium phyllosphericum]MBH8572435.1 hypothetical protein [Dendronalium phyllosphericum CENA369]